MKNVIVIIKPKSGVDLHNVEKEARGDHPLPTSAKQVSDGVWLMDIHTSFDTLAGLVHSARTRGLNVFVFAVEDVLHAPKEFLNLHQAEP